MKHVLTSLSAATQTAAWILQNSCLTKQLQVQAVDADLLAPVPSRDDVFKSMMSASWLLRFTAPHSHTSMSSKFSLKGNQEDIFVFYTTSIRHSKGLQTSHTRHGTKIMLMWHYSFTIFFSFPVYFCIILASFVSRFVRQNVQIIQVLQFLFLWHSYFSLQIFSPYNYNKII